MILLGLDHRGFELRLDKNLELLSSVQGIVIFRLAPP